MNRTVIEVTATEVTISPVFAPTVSPIAVTSAFYTGDMKSGLWTDPGAGWVLMQGNTIGNAASGADYANAAASALFVLLWTNLSNTFAPVSTGRGLSAEADFAANKKLTIPDMRTRVPLGAKASEVLCGVNAVLGAPLGESAHLLVESELPIVTGHTHVVATTPDPLTLGIPILDTSISVTQGSVAYQTVGDAASRTESRALDAVTATAALAGGFGSDFAHNITQLSLCVNFAIKL